MEISIIIHVDNLLLTMLEPRERSCGRIIEWEKWMGGVHNKKNLVWRQCCYAIDFSLLWWYTICCKGGFCHEASSFIP